MRLREVRQIITENIEQLTYKIHNRDNGNVTISGYHEIINALEKFKDLIFIADEITSLNNECQIILHSRTNQVIIHSSVFNKFENQINSIKSKCKTVILAIDQALPDQNEFSVSVKLPPLKNLSELVDFTHTLDIALSGAIVREDLNGKVELQNLDTGSNWIEIGVGTLMAFNFVGKMIRAALEITKKKQEYELTKQTLRFAKIHTDAMQAVGDGLSSNIKALCQYHTEKLIQESELTTSEGDYSNRLNASIEMLSSLLYKGAEFHQPLIVEAPKNTDFPNVTDYKLLNSAIKQLTSGPDSSIDSPAVPN